MGMASAPRIELATVVIASDAKQSSFVAATKKAGLLRRVAPRNDGERANVTALICPTGKSGNYGDSALNSFHACKCTARRQRVARMQRSEIRGNAATGSTGPGLRFAASGLRPSLRANGSRERAPDDRLRDLSAVAR